MQKRERIKYLNKLISGQKKEQIRLTVEKLAENNIMQMCGSSVTNFNE